MEPDSVTGPFPCLSTTNVVQARRPTVLVKGLTEVLANETGTIWPAGGLSHANLSRRGRGFPVVVFVEDVTSGCGGIDYDKVGLPF